MFLVRPDGDLVHGWAQGRPTTDVGYQEVRWHVEDLIDRAQHNVPLGGQQAGMKRLADVDWPMAASGQPLNRWAATTVLRHGRPTFLAVVSIVPDDDYSLLKGEKFGFSGRMMAVAGTLSVLMQTPLVQQMAAFAGV
jgi:hypothetical protein